MVKYLDYDGLKAFWTKCKNTFVNQSSYELFTIVTELPTKNIVKNKIYLVGIKNATGNNIYKEYVYTGDVTATYDASKWEEFGELTAEVDLKPYAKLTGANFTGSINVKTNTNSSAVINSDGFSIGGATGTIYKEGEISVSGSNRLTLPIKTGTLALTNETLKSISGATGADKYTISQIKTDNSVGSNITIPVVSDTVAGLMTPTLLSTLNAKIDNTTLNTKLENYVLNSRVKSTIVSAADTDILNVKAVEAHFMRNSGDTVNGDYTFNNISGSNYYTIIDSTDGLSVAEQNGNNKDQVTSYHAKDINVNGTILKFPSVSGTFALTNDLSRFISIDKLRTASGEDLNSAEIPSIEYLSSNTLTGAEEDSVFNVNATNIAFNVKGLIGGEHGVIISTAGLGVTGSNIGNATYYREDSIELATGGSLIFPTVTGNETIATVSNIPTLTAITESEINALS